MGGYTNTVKTGSVTGTGSIIRVDLGFAPSYVRLINKDDAGSLWPTMDWFPAMGDGYALKTLKVVDSGTTGNSSQAMISTNGVSAYAGQAPGSTNTGTVTIADGAKAVTGSSTKFLSELHVGDAIKIGGQDFTVAAITTDTACTVNEACVTTKTAVPYTNETGRTGGFLIGADGDMNVASETILYLATR